MTNGESWKLPQHLQKQEVALEEALGNLRAAYRLAIHTEEQLKAALQNAEKILDENNY